MKTNQVFVSSAKGTNRPELLIIRSQEPPQVLLNKSAQTQATKNILGCQNQSITLVHSAALSMKKMVLMTTEIRSGIIPTQRWSEK